MRIYLRKEDYPTIVAMYELGYQQKEISQQYGVTISGINHIIRHKPYLAYYTEDEFRKLAFKASKLLIPKPRKRIIQINKENTIVAWYGSISDASKQSHISRTALCNCLSGKSKTSGGFIWKTQLV